VAVAVDEVAEGVSGGNAAGGRHPEDLSAEAVRVLRVAGDVGVADAGVEHAVGAERDASAVVDVGLGDAAEYELRRLQGVEPEPDDAVVGGGGEVGVDPLVLGVSGAHREAEQAALAGGHDAGDRAERLWRLARP
jgi:hypothetical protein